MVLPAAWLHKMPSELFSYFSSLHSMRYSFIHSFIYSLIHSFFSFIHPIYPFNEQSKSLLSSSKNALKTVAETKVEKILLSTLFFFSTILTIPMTQKGSNEDADIKIFIFVRKFFFFSKRNTTFFFFLLLLLAFLKINFWTWQTNNITIGAYRTLQSAIV